MFNRAALPQNFLPECICHLGLNVFAKKKNLEGKLFLAHVFLGLQKDYVVCVVLSNRHRSYRSSHFQLLPNKINPIKE